MCVVACLLFTPSSSVVFMCLCVSVPSWHLIMGCCSALLSWEGGKTRKASGLSLWSLVKVNDLAVLWGSSGKPLQQGCGHAACLGSCMSDLSCFAGWVLRVEVWGRVAWACTVSSSVTLGVNPGHASDCCLTVLKPVFYVVPRHATKAMQHGKLFSFLIQARASSFSKWLTDLSLAGYWPSYNIPFHEKIYNLSGYASYVVKYGMDFSYELAPRAKIFRRDQGKVTNLESMKYIMRYNSKTRVHVLWSWS